MYCHPYAVRTQRPKGHISLLILTILNRCISVKTSLINIEFGDFVNLGVLSLDQQLLTAHNLQTRTVL